MDLSTRSCTRCWKANQKCEGFLTEGLLTEETQGYVRKRSCFRCQKAKRQCDGPAIDLNFLKTSVRKNQQQFQHPLVPGYQYAPLPQPPQYHQGQSAESATPIDAPTAAPAPRRIHRLKIKLEDFCDRYEISNSDCSKLRDLEYAPGRSEVEKLPVEEWKRVGFTKLGWECFLEVHTECLGDIARGCWDIEEAAYTIPAPRRIRRLIVKLEDFCDRYKISNSDCSKLRDLGYIPGRSEVEELPVEEWKRVGFTQLGWKDFLEAHTKCLADIAREAAAAQLT